MLENKVSATKQIIALAIGEVIVSAIVCLVYFLIGMFSYEIVTGVLLGSAVTVANFIFLCISVNRAVDRYIEKRGEREMSEEEAEEFARENAMQVQNAATRSYLIRTVSMLVTLVAAFFLAWFDPLATAIPLLMFRPILYVLELIKGKRGETK